MGGMRVAVGGRGRRRCRPTAWPSRTGAKPTARRRAAGPPRLGRATSLPPEPFRRRRLAVRGPPAPPGAGTGGFAAACAPRSGKARHSTGAVSKAAARRPAGAARTGPPARSPGAGRPVGGRSASPSPCRPCRHATARQRRSTVSGSGHGPCAPVRLAASPARPRVGEETAVAARVILVARPVLPIRGRGSGPRPRQCRPARAAVPARQGGSGRSRGSPAPRRHAGPPHPQDGAGAAARTGRWKRPRFIPRPGSPRTATPAPPVPSPPVPRPGLPAEAHERVARAPVAAGSAKRGATSAACERRVAASQTPVSDFFLAVPRFRERLLAASGHLACMKLREAGR